MNLTEMMANSVQKEKNYIKITEVLIRIRCLEKSSNDRLIADGLFVKKQSLNKNLNLSQNLGYFFSKN